MQTDIRPAQKLILLALADIADKGYTSKANSDMLKERHFTDLMRRASQGIRSMFTRPRLLSPESRESRENDARRWNILCSKYMQAGLESEECRRRANAELGLPADYSPGRRA
jgi:hypothetical protein